MLDGIRVPVAFGFHGDPPRFLGQGSSLVYNATPGHQAENQEATGAANSGPVLQANPLSENERPYT